jgi:hypothetical protein
MTCSTKLPELGLKEHVIRERVNELRDIAKTFGHTQQLRDHLSKFVKDLLCEQKEALDTKVKDAETSDMG